MVWVIKRSILLLSALTVAIALFFVAINSVSAAFGDCPKGYFFDPRSGVGCKQTHCNEIPNAHWSYEGYCICGSSGSTTENPLDPNKECYFPVEDESCPSCLAACVHLNEECPGYGTTVTPGSIQGGNMTPYAMLQGAFSWIVAVGSDLMEWGTGAKINQKDDPNHFFSGIFILPGGDYFDLRFFGTNVSANRKDGLALEWNFIEIKTYDKDSFIDGWSVGIGPGAVSGDSSSINVPNTPISPNINFANIRNWVSEQYNGATGWWNENVPWPLGGWNRPSI